MHIENVVNVHKVDNTTLGSSFVVTWRGVYVKDSAV